MVLFPCFNFPLYVAEFCLSKCIVFSDNGVIALSHKMQLGSFYSLPFFPSSPSLLLAILFVLLLHDAQANGFCFDREGS